MNKIQRIKSRIITALYLLGALIIGAFGAFCLWAFMWLCYDAGFTM